MVDSLRPLPFGVKYFLAALISHSHLAWSSLTKECVDQLRRSTSTGKALLACLSSPLKELLCCVNRFISPALLEACEELDKEEELLKGGVTYLHNQRDGWFGGNVSFSGSILLRDGKAIVQLQLPYKAASCRFSRRFGSSRFLRLRVKRLSLEGADRKSDKEEDSKALEGLLSRPFCIFDRFFHFLCAKDLHLFEVRSGDIPSTWSFYDWHGPWQDNKDGILLKHLRRLILSLSASVPGPMIPVDRVRRMRDILSTSGRIMTDGAAPISHRAMMQIASQLGLATVPTAVQGRYDGAKGVWYVVPVKEQARWSENGEGGSIWIGIRDSQRKLNRGQTLDVSHQVLDVLRVSQATTPSCLSKQILLVMSHNGVPHRTLIEMQERQLRQMVNNFFVVDAVELAKVLDRAGGVYNGRARRAAPHLAASKGFSNRVTEDREEDEERREKEGGITPELIAYQNRIRKGIRHAHGWF